MLRKKHLEFGIKFDIFLMTEPHMSDGRRQMSDDMPDYRQFLERDLYLQSNFCL